MTVVFRFWGEWRENIIVTRRVKGLIAGQIYSAMKHSLPETLFIFVVLLIFWRDFS